MDRLVSRLPSPALVVAVIALVVALAGTSIALPGRNTVNSRDIVNGTIRTQDVRNGSLTDRDIRRRSFRGTRFRIESVGGNAVKEQVLEVEKLPKVPAAATADNAERLDGKDASDYVAKSELLWALVDADTGSASVVHGRGATGASSPGTGRFVVTFDRNIAGCGVAATLSDATGAAGPAGEISTDQPTANSVEINTYNSAGSAADPFNTDGFHLQVIC